jgi:hypothetical protein
MVLSKSQKILVIYHNLVYQSQNISGVDIVLKERASASSGHQKKSIPHLHSGMVDWQTNSLHLSASGCSWS